jgi:S-adenosylmethionine hydrolase
MNLLAARWPQTDTYQATTNPAFGAKTFDRIQYIPFAKTLKADTFSSYRPSPNLKFGFSLDQPSPYSALQVITDFNDETSNARILTHALRVARFVHQHQTALSKDLKTKDNEPWLKFSERDPNQDFKNVDFLPFVSDIPFGNVSYGARALSELWTDAEREVFIHVVDPGVGNGQDRAILVEQNGSVFIGPNNGSLSKLAKKLRTIHRPFDLYAIDLEKVQQLKQAVHKSKAYTLPDTFHGRDVFAVIAGAVIAGVNPASFSKAGPQMPVVPDPFAAAIKTIPQTINEAVKPLYRTIQALPDNTYGNVLTNVFPSEVWERLLQLAPEKRPLLEIYNPATKDILVAHIGTRFSDAPFNTGVVYRGSSDIDQKRGGHTGALEIAINGGNAAKDLGLDKEESIKLSRRGNSQAQAILGSIPLQIRLIPPKTSESV